MKHIIGVDLGGTNTKVGLVTPSGRIVKRTEVPTQTEKGSKVVIKNILDSIKKVKSGKILGIGIGSPGPLDYKKGIITNPVNLPFKNTPLKKIIQNKFKLPTFLDNDANCFALAETLFGNGKGKNNVIGLTLGTGIGGGIIINKKIYHGRGNAAEIGHMTIDYNGPKSRCGNDGCIETHAAARGILSRSKGLKAGSPLDIHKLALKNNSRAKKVFSDIGEFLGIAIANLNYAFDPDVVVLGGKISNSWKFFSKSMLATIKKRYFSKPCKVVKTGLGRDAGILGAAALVLEKK
jgi:glucokinase